MENKVATETILDDEKQDMPTIPAYFLSITVESIRCFGPDKQTLDLSDGKGRPAQWTIILGDNGVGKTTLLQSLVALTPTIPPPFAEQLLYPMYREEAGKKYVLPRWIANPKMFNEWMPLRRTGDSDENHRMSARFFIGTKLQSNESGRVREKFSISRPMRFLAGFFDKADYEELGGLICFGYGASRRMGKSSLSEKTENDPFASLFSDSAELLNAEEWLLQADYAAHAAESVSAQRRAKKRRDEIKDVLINLLPEIDDIKVRRFTERELEPRVEVKTPYGWVMLEELSLGYKTLIAWMVDFASRMFDHYPDSPNPLTEPAVVLVDEIDLHLHPKWQRTLMSYLSERFRNTQFIATAHSPLVVQAAQDANIVLLRREDNEVLIENNVEAVRNWRVDQILTSDLFGLESARPPETDKFLAERTKILSKARLTKKDRGRLKKLEEEIGSLPTGETPEEIEAMDVIRRAAERLKAEGY